MAYIKNCHQLLVYKSCTFEGSRNLRAVLVEDALSAQRATKHSNFAKNLERNAVYCKEGQNRFCKESSTVSGTVHTFCKCFSTESNITVMCIVQQKYTLTVVMDRNTIPQWHLQWCATKTFTVVYNRKRCRELSQLFAAAELPKYKRKK